MIEPEITDALLAELHSYAAAIHRGEWESSGNDVVEVHTEAIVAECGGKPFWSDFPEVADFIAAANPPTVLALVAEVRRLQQHVHDLQSGMFINCVYCGHRYGPKDEVPCTMADALKEHVERCPKHPMSALRAERDRLCDKLDGLEMI